MSQNDVINGQLFGKTQNLLGGVAFEHMKLRRKTVRCDAGRQARLVSGHPVSETVDHCFPVAGFSHLDFGAVNNRAAVQFAGKLGGQSDAKLKGLVALR